MRILLLSHVPNDPDGGASRVYHLLRDSLEARNHEVDLLHLEDVPLPHNHYARLVARRVALPQLLSRRARRNARPDVDLIMASSGTAYPLYRRLGRLHSRPILVNHIHGLTVYDHLAGITESNLGHRRQSVANKLLTGPRQIHWDSSGVKFADAIITQNLRDLSLVKTMIDRNRHVINIPPGVHPILLEASRKSPSLDRERGAILWFGTWEARKGAFYIAQAFRKLRENYPKATLTIGGTGLPPDQIVSGFAEADRASVNVLPRITVEEQIKVFKSSSIFLFPSISEGFGLALVEAMCFGLAAITTNTGFAGDFLRDGENALIVPTTAEHIGRALSALVEDDALRWRVAEAGRSKAQTFTLTQMLDAYEGFFNKLASRTENNIE